MSEHQHEDGVCWCGWQEEYCSACGCSLEEHFENDETGEAWCEGCDDCAQFTP